LLTQKHSQVERSEFDEPFHDLLSLFSSPAVVIDKNGSLLDANEKALKIIETSEHRPFRRKILDLSLLTPESKKALSEYLSKKILIPRKKYLETVDFTRNVKQIQKEFSVRRITYKSKPAVLVSFNNLREREHILERMVEERTKDLRKNEEKLRSIFDSSPDAIIVIGTDGTITECNQATLELHRSLSKDVIIGKNIIELVAERDREKVSKDLMKAVKYGVAKNLEYLFLTKDEYEFPIEASISGMKDINDVVYSLVVEVKDITERKRMEENLRQYSLHLEKLVEERTRMLHDAERMAAIGELAAMVGHDLRNPLMGIAGAAYYLKSKIGSKLDEKTLEMFNHIERGIEYSDKIINDLLDYSKNIQLNFLEITPREMILESLQLIKVPNNVEIINETQIKPRIKVDVEKMKRVFINIINNSFDAMPNGGKLTIRGRKNKDCFEFHLSDTGMGVPRKIKQKLWNPLITSKAKGMGLGLAICKRMIDAHNGSITLKSTVGKGTTLIVKVPIEPKL
jgi:PAS domain S-box-containing protein